MTSTADTGLLPAGFSDMLPSDAEFEAYAVERLIAQFKSRGYQRIKPPLLEYEASLLSGPGAAMEGQTLRLVDPASQKVMGIRADHTPQAARIAATRLANSPRPLRLCYGGEVVRVQGGQIRPERQFAQVGAELIGAANAAADIEVIVMAVDALTEMGAQGLSVDLGLPNLAPTLAGHLAEWPHLSKVLDSKDAAALNAFENIIGEECVTLFRTLISLSGKADTALRDLKNLTLMPEAKAQVSELEAVVEGVQHRLPDLNVTIDPVEHRGFEYHAGISFTIFAKGVRGELGSGGRYTALGTDSGEEAASEQATGFSLFTDSLLRALPHPDPAERALAASNAKGADINRLRAEGWIIINDLSDGAPIDTTAQALGCRHILDAQGLRSRKTALDQNIT